MILEYKIKLISVIKMILKIKTIIKYQNNQMKLNPNKANKNRRFLKKRNNK